MIDAMQPCLPVLWRDEHLVAVHKPAGWLVHRTGLDAHGVTDGAATKLQHDIIAEEIQELMHLTSVNAA